MNVIRILAFAALALAFPSFGQAQGRWEKFQQKLDDIRPKGKLIQQIKESIEGDQSADEDAKQKASEPAARAKPAAKPSDKNAQNSTRRVPVQNASQRSILSTAKNLPSNGVTLGIQVDPGFLPSRKLLISEVDPDSPAAQAGIRTGDQITAIGGIPTNSLKSLDTVLGSLNPGDQVVVELIRNRKPEKTLVRFAPAKTSAEIVSSESLPEAHAVELPPPPEMLDQATSIVPSTNAPESLRSVLSATTGMRPAEASTAAPKKYFPADSESEQTVVDDPPTAPFADDFDSATPQQLRERIRQQQRLIEQLQQQLQLLQQASSTIQNPLDSESLILDPDGN